MKNAFINRWKATKGSDNLKDPNLSIYSALYNNRACYYIEPGANNRKVLLKHATYLFYRIHKHLTFYGENSKHLFISQVSLL